MVEDITWQEIPLLFTAAVICGAVCVSLNETPGLSHPVSYISRLESFSGPEVMAPSPFR